MKANKFPGNVMKMCGIKSWCQLGVVAGGALILLLMGLTGWGFDWNDSLPGDVWWKWIWNFICVLVSFFGMMVIVFASVIGAGWGIRHGAITGWKWARDNCEQINYEDNEDV